MVKQIAVTTMQPMDCHSIRFKRSWNKFN